METVEEAPPFMSTLDLFLLSALVGFAVYWFFFRKDDTPSDDEFKKLSVVQSNLIRSESFELGFIGRMKNKGRNIAILYGSQTGTGEEFANRLAKDAQRYGMKALVLDPEECNADDLPQLIDIPNSLVLMCMATYGEGDPTDNAQDFHDWLKQGDTIIEEDFVTWKEGLWPAVCQRFGLEASMEDGSFRAYSFTKYEDGDLDPKTIYTGEVARLHSYDNQRPPYDAKNPYLAPIQVNRELH
uniref:Flavodoxin-like domain-containing protein n=1 Tax=Ciona savignyi TaxID=51511 RepID=H2YK27_CIOSA